MTPKVSQGVTTVVTGNCGVSMAPLKLPTEPLVSPLDLLAPKDYFKYTTFSDYISALKAHPPALNVVPLVGHITLRWNAMNYDSSACTSRAATRAELEKMKKLLEEAMIAGAAGMSTGLYYDAGFPAPTAE